MCFLKFVKRRKQPNVVKIRPEVDGIDFYKFIEDWNITYPIDRWWREKHGVAFNSPEHRAFSFIDQLFEYEEEKIYQDVDKLYDKKERYNPELGNWLKDQDLSELDESITNDDLIDAYMKEEKESVKKKGDDVRQADADNG